MERLTFKSEITGGYLIPSSKLEVHGALADKLGYLEDLEEQGQLTIRHFLAGDYVYQVAEPNVANRYRVIQCEVWCVTVDDDFEAVYHYSVNGEQRGKFYNYQIGSRFFRNEKEARKMCEARNSE